MLSTVYLHPLSRQQDVALHARVQFRQPYAGHGITGYRFCTTRSVRSYAVYIPPGIPPVVFDRNRLDLGILEQRLVALLTTVPRLLKPAERELDAAARAVGVDEHLPGPNLSGKPVRLPDIAGPHRGDQAVVCSVGEFGGLFDTLERGCRQHGAEHLFLSQPVSGSYTTEEGRLEEVATAQPIFPYDIAACEQI